MPQNLDLFNSFLLFTTAFVAGALNAVAGGGSFITFPTLVFLGVAPINANASNNTALWIASIASASAYRHNLNIPKQQFFSSMLNQFNWRSNRLRNSVIHITECF